MYINLDFDGTCVKHDYPNIGEEIDKCVETLQELVKNGHNIILFTMRSGKELTEAVGWFADRGVALAGVQMHPTQHTWTKSTKSYAHLMIDDTALGCPLIKGNGRDYVDWYKVWDWLVENNWI